jgi:hypothetical protein
MSKITKSTLTTRMSKVESIVESMLASNTEALDRSVANNNKLVEHGKRVQDVADSIHKLIGLVEAQQNTIVDEVATTQAQQPTVKPEAPIYNYQTSEMSSKVVEPLQEQPIGCFDVLTALVEQFGTGKNGVNVSAPHIKKDGTLGKSYILSMPRIDENFKLIDSTQSIADRKKQAVSLWRAVAFNSFTFTGRFGSTWTTYIKAVSEDKMLPFLKGLGVHIPVKDHRLEKESNEEDSS